MCFIKGSYPPTQEENASLTPVELHAFEQSPWSLYNMARLSVNTNTTNAILKMLGRQPFACLWTEVSPWFQLLARFPTPVFWGVFQIPNSNLGSAWAGLGGFNWAQTSGDTHRSISLSSPTISRVTKMGNILAQCCAEHHLVYGMFTHSVHNKDTENLLFSYFIFSDITPPRLNHLPHVRSEPVLSLNSLLKHHQYQQLDCNGRRLVQVSPC